MFYKLTSHSNFLQMDFAPLLWSRESIFRSKRFEDFLYISCWLKVHVENSFLTSEVVADKQPLTSLSFKRQAEDATRSVSVEHIQYESVACLTPPPPSNLNMSGMQSRGGSCGFVCPYV